MKRYGNCIFRCAAGDRRARVSGRRPTGSRGLHRKRRHGITLTEVVIVLLILGILAAAAVPHVYRSVGRYGVDAAARRIALDLGLARKQALMNSASRSVEFSIDPLSSYLLPGVSGQKNPAVDYEIRLGDTPYGATIVSASFGDDDVVIFNGHGFPDSDGSVVIRAGEFQRTITLETNGEVSVQ